MTGAAIALETMGRPVYMRLESVFRPKPYPGAGGRSRARLSAVAVVTAAASKNHLDLTAKHRHRHYRAPKNMRSMMMCTELRYDDDGRNGK